jgi:heptosyltransferase-1
MTPPAIDMASARRVLIIKLSSLGDIIHALPVSAALHEAFPHLELTWAVEEGFAPLVSGNPCLAHILTLPKLRGRQLRSPSFHRDYFRRLRDVRSRRFDLTLDLQGLTKSALVAAASGARVRLGYHWLREAATFFERPIPRRPQSVHIVDQYLDVARFLGADVAKPKFPFFIPRADAEAVDVMLEEGGLRKGTPFAAINPASALVIKQWDAVKYAELIDLLYVQFGLTSVLVTADKSVAAQVAAMVKHSFVNLAGRTNLKQLAAVVKQSVVHICGDTGSGHLAAAFGTPVVALVGPTDADRLCPYGQRNNVIRHSNLCGAKCSWHHCQFQHPRCLEAISVAEVESLVAKSIERVTGGK